MASCVLLTIETNALQADSRELQESFQMNVETSNATGCTLVANDGLLVIALVQGNGQGLVSSRPIIHTTSKEHILEISNRATSSVLNTFLGDKNDPLIYCEVILPSSTKVLLVCSKIVQSKPGREFILDQYLHTQNSQNCINNNLVSTVSAHGSRRLETDDDELVRDVEEGELVNFANGCARFNGNGEDGQLFELNLDDIRRESTFSRGTMATVGTTGTARSSTTARSSGTIGTIGTIQSVQMMDKRDSVMSSFSQFTFTDD